MGELGPMPTPGSFWASNPELENSECFWVIRPHGNCPERGLDKWLREFLIPIAVTGNVRGQNPSLFRLNQFL